MKQVENNAYYIFQVLKTTSEVRPPVLFKFVMRRPAKKNHNDVENRFSSSERARGACLSKAALKLGSLDPSFLVASSWARASWEL